jgi:acetoin utilization deacetylase AcuC-like enzyme
VISRMGRALYLHHPSSLDHDTGDHPEQPARITAIERALERHDWLGYERELAPRADRAAVEAVHPPAYVDRIAGVSERGGGMLDLDTVASTGSFEAALHSAGGALRAVEQLMGGAAEVAFCGLRPPGHHAESERAMGFCLFNNVALGARHALDRHGARKVLVLDWDVHHGNGTNDIFYEADSVLYISIHQSPLYPGTGALSDNGVGAGEGYTVNLPVPPGAGHADWLALLVHVIAPVARAFGPDLLLVSAGYDAHRDDPLANCTLTDDSYASLASGMRALSQELEAPLCFVLEGGYDLRALASSVVATMAAARNDGALPGVPTTALAQHAVRHYDKWWPVLSH